jgi:4-hydroxybenzoate polyprenyltransferase
MTLTGLLNLLAGPVLNEYKSDKPSSTTLLARFPLVIFWVWLNFLIFFVGNQRLPKSIEEDSINKPWRPIPSNRLNPHQATTLWGCLHLAVIIQGMYLDTTTFTLALLILGWLYNDREGGSNPLARNAINACAVVCFVLGATIVAYGGNPFAVNHKGQWWY